MIFSSVYLISKKKDQLNLEQQINLNKALLTVLAIKSESLYKFGHLHPINLNCNVNTDLKRVRLWWTWRLKVSAGLCTLYAIQRVRISAIWRDAFENGYDLVVNGYDCRHCEQDLNELVTIAVTVMVTIAVKWLRLPSL